MIAMRRMTVALLSVILASLVLSGAVFASQKVDANDVKLDSPIRSILLDPSETKVDLDIDLFNYADTRRLVAMELLDLPEGWDIAIWNAFFDFQIFEISIFKLTSFAATP